MTEPKDTTTSVSSNTPLTMDDILDAVQRLKPVGPIFTRMRFSRGDYEKLMKLADLENKGTERSLIQGIAISIDSTLPVGIAAAIDTEGNLWMLSIPDDKMWNLGKPHISLLLRW